MTKKNMNNFEDDFVINNGKSFYKMNHKSRGIFLMLFYESTSRSYKSLARNVAANKDIEAMKKLGEKLNFQVLVHRGFMTYDQTINILKDTKKRVKNIGTEQDCFVCLIKSFVAIGGELLTSDAKSFHLDDYTKHFNAENCVELNGKPKLFFVDASKGIELDERVNIDNLVCQQQAHCENSGRGVIHIQLAKNKCFNLPDFLFAFSTTDGFKSRSTLENGSLFLQTVYQVFAKYYDRKYVTEMLTYVGYYMAHYLADEIKLTSNTNAECSIAGERATTKQIVQMPSFTSRLTKTLYFCPKFNKKKTIFGKIKHRLKSEENLLEFNHEFCSALM